MKHLLNGVAIAAALAIAAPAWAQAPMTPTSPSKAAPKAAATATPEAGAPMASKQRHKRGSHRMARRGGRGGAPSMTDQLNREELARIQGGGAPMPPQGTAGQPNELRGIPGAGEPSASAHPGMPR
jgi:hypothetical protein